MKAIKAFNSDLCATLGKGVMQYEPGKTYKESEAKCARNGFHCAENPLCALGYYSGLNSRFLSWKQEEKLTRMEMAREYRVQK